MDKSILVVLQLLVFVASASEAVKETHYIHWNSSNPIFRIDNTDHIIDVNRGNKPWEYDQVNIICPVYRPGSNFEAEKETSIIYSVTKDEYETCRITQSHPRVIAICNKPHELMYFTITFRSFTPTPGGMEFTPGQDYYFISTSSNDDLYQRVGGRCSSHHMKVAFKVANNNDEQQEVTFQQKTAVNNPRNANSRPPAAFPPGGGHDFHGHHSGGESSYKDSGGFMFRHPISSKKREEFDVHPNDVVKHEASRLASISAEAAEASKASSEVKTQFSMLLCGAIFAVLRITDVFFTLA